MKSQVISVLAKYYSQDLGKKVLLVTPQTKPRDELIKRIDSLYGIKVPVKLGKGKIQSIITQGLLNKKDYKDPEKREKLVKTLESFDIVLVDEVEYCMNEGGEFIFDSITPEGLYGFSGTSDKFSGKMINLRNGLSDPTVSNNSTLIKYFGPALVYRQPLDLTLNLISLKAASMNNSNLKLWEIPEDCGNIYLEIMAKIFTNQEVSETIVRVVKNYPMTFIPINNLQKIIYTWIEDHFLGKFKILLVCGEGYLYYDLDKNKTNLDLKQACDKIIGGEVSVIFSTSSGFRALDIPNLKHILLIQGKIAGSVLQQIGRVARQKEFDIITLEPLNGKALPVLTKTQKVQKDMIKEYYSYCKINEYTVNEDDLRIQ